MHLIPSREPVHVATSGGGGGSNRIPHGFKPPCPEQIIEVSCPGKTVRAKRRDCDRRTSRSGSGERMGMPRIARCTGVVIGTHDDFCVGMALVVQNLHFWTRIPNKFQCRVFYNIVDDA